jgi:hypothetical protein
MKITKLVLVIVLTITSISFAFSQKKSIKKK